MLASVQEAFAAGNRFATLATTAGTIACLNGDIERYAQARSHGAAPLLARREALETALIPMLNSFFAVGLVALPGMMTGQILSGVAPHLAVRYQVMVMCMTLGAAGLAAAGYLAQEARADADEGAG